MDWSDIGERNLLYVRILDIPTVRCSRLVLDYTVGFVFHSGYLDELFSMIMVINEME